MRDGVISQVTQRELEIAYLERIVKSEDFASYAQVYTELPAEARIQTESPAEELVANLAALRLLDMEHTVYPEDQHSPDGHEAKYEKLKGFDQLSDVLTKQHKPLYRAAIIGDPGSGKTTTLRRFTYMLAQAALDNETAPLPIFVPLGTYDGTALDLFIERQLGGLTLNAYLPERIVLLLDGLNETAHAHVSAIEQWLKDHPQVRAIVSCRKLDYTERKLPLQRVDVLPLDWRGIRRFAEAYIKPDAAERLFWTLAGDDLREYWKTWRAQGRSLEDLFDSDEIALNTSVAQDGRLRDIRTKMRRPAPQDEYPTLLQLARNPFMLKVILRVYVGNRGSLPANRGLLMADFVRDLFMQRGKPAAEAQKIHWIDTSVQELGLAALAHAMIAGAKGTAVDVGWARKRLMAALPGQDAEALLYLAASAGIIDKGATVRFSHQLLQEYFAALEIRSNLTPERGVPLTRYCHTRWWQVTGWEEPLVLLAGLQPGMAQRLAAVNPLLALRALEEGLPDADALHVVQQRLVAAMRGDAPPTARAEAGRIINRIGDPRRGVGVVALTLNPSPKRRVRLGEGLPNESSELPSPSGAPRSGEGLGVRAGLQIPDILWCDPIADNATWIYQDGEHPPLPPYQISKYPVTNAQFQAFIDDKEHGYNQREWWTDAGWAWKGERAAPDEYDDPAFRLPNHPRVYVRWYEAVAFCNWLTWRTAPEVWLPIREVWQTLALETIPGLIRLPTEQEWERAARGTDGHEYPYKGPFDAQKGNTDETGIGQTSAVGIFPDGASPCGALDMSGNVWK